MACSRARAVSRCSSSRSSTISSSQRAIQKVGGQWRLESEPLSAADSLPHDLRQMVRANLARLEPEDRALIDCASAAGPTFSALLLAGALGRDVLEVEDRCERLVDVVEDFCARRRRGMAGRRGLRRICVRSRDLSGGRLSAIVAGAKGEHASATGRSARSRLRRARRRAGARARPAFRDRPRLRPKRSATSRSRRQAPPRASARARPPAISPAPWRWRPCWRRKRRRGRGRRCCYSAPGAGAPPAIFRPQCEDLAAMVESARKAGDVAAEVSGLVNLSRFHLYVDRRAMPAACGGGGNERARHRDPSRSALSRRAISPLSVSCCCRGATNTPSPAGARPPRSTIPRT